jgi:hypothetical protein
VKLPRVLTFLAVGLVFAALSYAEDAPALPSFWRAIDTADKLRAVQTSSVEYSAPGGAGPQVWLIGVCHMGTLEYFRAVQQRLDAQTVVLFEGADVDEIQCGLVASVDDPGPRQRLSEVLGLTWQLQGIDYRRPHFINSDLPWDEVEQQVSALIAAHSGARARKILEDALARIQGSPGAHEMLKPLLAGPPETTRLLFVEGLPRHELDGSATNELPELKALSEIIITKRNAVVMRDLRAQLALLKHGQSVAIFYGANHMPELARRLRDELHYTAGPERWDTAFTADPAKSTIPLQQIRLLLEKARTRGGEVDAAVPAAPAP